MADKKTPRLKVPKPLNKKGSGKRHACSESGLVVVEEVDSQGPIAMASLEENLSLLTVDQRMKKEKTGRRGYR